MSRNDRDQGRLFFDRWGRDPRDLARCKIPVSALSSPGNIEDDKAAQAGVPALAAQTYLPMSASISDVKVIKRVFIAYATAVALLAALSDSFSRQRALVHRGACLRQGALH